MNADTWYKEGKYTSINQLKVFFNRSGKGEPLICIHGFPSSSWDFEAIWPSLTSCFDVMAHDLIGLGRSAKPNQAITVRLQADIVEELTLEQGINTAHILAHDLGDTVAQELLARQLEKKSKINWLSCILLNGGIFPEVHRPLLIQKLLISPLGFLFAKLLSEFSLKRNMTNIFSKEHPPSEEFIRETWKLLSENKGISMIPRLIRYMKERSTYRERWVAPLINTLIPIRLINGIQDPISGNHMAEHFAKLIPNADIVRLKNAGHYPHVETPGEVLEAIFEFHDHLPKKDS